MVGRPGLARRVVRLSVVILLPLLLVGFVAATARLFIWPPTDLPSRADAVVSLGGDIGQLRQKRAIDLAVEGYAPVAVISRGGVRAVPCPGPVRGIRIICFRADPLNTRGEAEEIALLCARYHWHRIIIVSERTQATRARLLVKRCTRVSLEMVPVADPRARLVYFVAYEWGALVKALVFVPGC